MGGWSIVLNRDKRQYNREILELLVMISQVTITMLVPIVICTYGAWWLGKKVGINWLVIVGFFVGAIAGFRSVYIILRNFINR